MKRYHETKTTGIYESTSLDVKLGNSRQKLSKPINAEVRHFSDPNHSVAEMGLMVGKVIRRLKLCGALLGLLGIGLLLYWLL